MGMHTETRLVSYSRVKRSRTYQTLNSLQYCTYVITQMASPVSFGNRRNTLGFSSSQLLNAVDPTLWRSACELICLAVCWNQS